MQERTHVTFQCRLASNLKQKNHVLTATVTRWCQVTVTDERPGDHWQDKLLKYVYTVDKWGEMSKSKYLICVILQLS